MDAKLIADSLSSIAVLLIYVVFFLQFRRVNRLENTVEEVKKTACHALFDVDKLRTQFSNVDKLRLRVDELEADVNWLRSARIVGTWEGKKSD